MGDMSAGGEGATGTERDEPGDSATDKPAKTTPGTGAMEDTLDMGGEKE